MKIAQPLSFSALCLSLFFAPQLYGQTIDDALIFSQETNGTSARINGMSDAQTALGGDISTINGNPAGLGFFGRSDISLTLNYLQNGNKTTYEGMNSSSKKGTLGMDPAATVFHGSVRKGSGWQNFNMGVSYTRTHNFNNFRSYEAETMTSTYVGALAAIMAPGSNFEEDFYFNSK